MAKLESYSNLSKLQEDLWKKNFCTNFDLGLSLYSKASDLSFKSSFTQKSNAKGSATFGSTYFQYKAAQWLLKEQFTSGSLLKTTLEYTHPKLSQAKFKLEVETSKPNEYKHTLSGDFTHDNYKAKGSLVNLNDIKLNVVAGSNGKGAGLDLTFKADQKKLIEDHFLFKEGDRFLEACNLNRDWPSGRGIFHNNDKTFLVWVNEEDQLRIISMQPGANIYQVFERLCRAASHIETVVKFAHDDHLGYITSCPTNLGTALRGSVHIKLPLLS